MQIPPYGGHVPKICYHFGDGLYDVLHFLHGVVLTEAQAQGTVGNIMHKGDENPTVLADTTVQDALFVITDKGLGAVSVVDENGIMQGVLTDGDIRRGLSKGVDFLQRPVRELMTANPKTITQDKLAAQALHLMESNKPKPITVLPVLDKERKVIGLLHMTDLVRQGVV